MDRRTYGHRYHRAIAARLAFAFTHAPPLTARLLRVVFDTTRAIAAAAAAAAAAAVDAAAVAVRGTCAGLRLPFMIHSRSAASRFVHVQTQTGHTSSSHPPSLCFSVAPTRSEVAQCGGCVGTGGCGYCLSTLRCVEGSAVGPSDGSPCPNWYDHFPQYISLCHPQASSRQLPSPTALLWPMQNPSRRKPAVKSSLCQPACYHTYQARH